MPPIRLLIRCARKLQDAWLKSRRQHESFEFSWTNACRCWSNLTAAKRTFDLAMRHGFHSASRLMQEDLRWRRNEVQRHLQSLCEEPLLFRQVPTLADWFCELQSLDEEFGTLSLDLKLGIVRVATEPITLKDVSLGRFSIELHDSRLSTSQGSSCFEIGALDPNPASGREEVLHPHVNDGELCAGDAAEPIAKALAEGRISEAFLLIRAVLTYYNARSAYVKLEEWDGITCGDCSGRMHRDASSYCDGCHRDLCDGCASFCRSCDETRCAGCLDPCDGCSDLCCTRCLELIPGNESLCSSCRGICAGCDQVLRQSHLDESGCCPECAEADESLPPSPLEEAHAS